MTEKAKTARSPAARRNSATELFMRGSNKSGASSPEGHGRGIRRLLDLAGCVKKYRASLSCVSILTRIGCVCISRRRRGPRLGIGQRSAEGR